MGRHSLSGWVVSAVAVLAAAGWASAETTVIRSASSGAWSAPATWEGGQVPTAGSKALVRAGHRVTYDVNSDRVLRSVHVAGTLAFAPDRDTRLDVGLLMVRPGEDVSETGIGTAAGSAGHDHHHHHADADSGAAKPVLEIGTADRPIDANHKALIRLAYVE